MHRAKIAKIIEVPIHDNHDLDILRDASLTLLQCYEVQ